MTFFPVSGDHDGSQKCFLVSSMELFLPRGTVDINKTNQNKKKVNIS